MLAFLIETRRWRGDVFNSHFSRVVGTEFDGFVVSFGEATRAGDLCVRGAPAPPS